MNTTLYYLIHNLSVTDEIKQLCRLLNRYNDKYYKNMTREMVACYLGDLDTVKHISDEQMVKTDDVNWQCLHYAVSGRNLEVIQLLSNGQLNFIPSVQDLSLKILVESQQLDKFAALCRVKIICDLNNNQNILQQLIEYETINANFVPYIRILLQNRLQIEDFSVLVCALAFTNNLQRIQTFPKSDINIVIQNGITPLRCAIVGGALDVVTYLTDGYFDHIPTESETDLMQILKHYDVQTYKALQSNQTEFFTNQLTQLAQVYSHNFQYYKLEKLQLEHFAMQCNALKILQYEVSKNKNQVFTYYYIAHQEYYSRKSVYYSLYDEYDNYWYKLNDKDSYYQNSCMSLVRRTVLMDAVLLLRPDMVEVLAPIQHGIKQDGEFTAAELLFNAQFQPKKLKKLYPDTSAVFASTELKLSDVKKIFQLLLQYEDDLASLSQKLQVCAFVDDSESLKAILSQHQQQQVSMRQSLDFALKLEACNIMKYLTNNYFDHFPTLEDLSIFDAIQKEDVNRVKLLAPFYNESDRQEDLTALMFAAKTNYVDAVKCLVKTGNFTYKEGQKTALMVACEHRSLESAHVLVDLESGLKDNTGQTALYYLTRQPQSRRHQNHLAIRLLRRLGEVHDGLTTQMVLAYTGQYHLFGCESNQQMMQCDKFCYNTFNYAILGQRLHGLRTMAGLFPHAWNKVAIDIIPFLKRRMLTAELEFALKSICVPKTKSKALFDSMPQQSQVRLVKLQRTYFSGYDARALIGKSVLSVSSDQQSTRFDFKLSNPKIERNDITFESKDSILCEKQRQLRQKQQRIIKQSTKLASDESAQLSLQTEKSAPTKQKFSFTTQRAPITPKKDPPAQQRRQSWQDQTVRMESSFNRKILSQSLTVEAGIFGSRSNFINRIPKSAALETIRACKQCHRGILHMVRQKLFEDLQ